ncbi:FAD-dependent monooxygenase [Kitasatospora azatica]|uniref:FAD-dependent monooxygenase n=1 Tax=Kitasatospora azatica TaxID=58347 RepID=UPI000561C9B5|nr:FAD-dependent monooxygenase [Kitasatospora azatica]
MQNTKVLISGASVAGPALAYWLGHYGFEPTVVELAPALREGGYAVDFRGTSHLSVLERMGVLEELRELQTGGSPWSFVDQDGRELLGLPREFTGGDLEVRRADLSRVLYRRSLDRTEYLFGDSIATLTDTAEGVRVSFEHGPDRLFDLVIGADGIHSNTRRLTFGPEEQFVRHLGYYVAGWDVPNHLGLTGGSVTYNVPGKAAGVGVDTRDTSRGNAMFLFASPKLDIHYRDRARQQQVLTEAFAGLGWETPRLLAGLADSREFYFDSISRADLPTWSKGRIALVGDAAAGATLGGMGTGAAILAAYTLAGELATANGDFRAAYTAYENRLRSFATRCQKGGDRAGHFIAPRRGYGARLRNTLLGRPALLNMMLREGQKVAADMALPDYPAALAA